MPNFLKDVFTSIAFLKPFFFEFRFKFFIVIALMLVVAGSTASYAYLVKEVLDRIFIEKNAGMLIILPIIIIIITFVKNCALFLQTRMMQVLITKVTLNIQSAMYKKYLCSDMEVFDSSSTGSMIAKIFHTAGGVADALSNILITSVREFLTVVALLVVLFFQSPALTALSFLAIPFTVFPVVIISRKLRREINTARKGMEDVMSYVDDSLKFPRLVKSYVAEEFETTRVTNIFRCILSIRRKIASLAAMLPSINETISIFGVSAVIVYGGYSVINGNMTSGEFFAFFTAMTIAYKPLKSLTHLNVIIQNFLVATKVIRETLDKENKIQEKPNAISLQSVNGDISFNNVSFRYNASHQNMILQNITFSIKAGKMLAIVGPTGAGKSTIISLLERFYEAESGSILIDGTNIQDVTLSSLRKAMSLVSQDVQLLNDTIENNIKYVNTHATHEEVAHAARLANAEEFINRMPDGYQTMVGQSGVKLSGGQKQRIAIARAILQNAPILLLDEATSALDSVSEKLIQDALEKFMQGKTTIAIAHRLSTIIHADKILVMNNGTIVEQGTHDELIQKNGHYQSLYNTQFLR